MIDHLETAGARTATGVDHLRQHSLVTLQKMEQGILNSVLDIIRTTINPIVAPKIWVQFRFPRSRKKRIRNKWYKDSKNWREERVNWKIKGGKFTRDISKFSL